MGSLEQVKQQSLHAVPNVQVLLGDPKGSEDEWPYLVLPGTLWTALPFSFQLVYIC